MQIYYTNQGEPVVDSIKEHLHSGPLQKISAVIKAHVMALMDQQQASK